MTTEDAFQAALDANPDDHVCRLAFADWLEEQGDPRAAGYRALGMLWERSRHSVWYGWYWANDRVVFSWSFKKARWYFPSRRKAEDAAALAYAEMAVPS